MVGPDESFTASFNPCTVGMWNSMLLWVKLCALGWLTSMVGFVVSFVKDVLLYVRVRRRGTMANSEG
jgi:hypothetical protein